MPDSSEEASVVQDKSLTVYGRWDARMRETIKSLITDDLIAEHRNKPLGQHSDALDRVLNYFRRAPLPGKYVIVSTKPHEEWRIGVLSGRRGVPPKLIEEESFGSEAEALHGVFVRRVEDLTQS